MRHSQPAFPLTVPLPEWHTPPEQAARLKLAAEVAGIVSPVDCMRAIAEDSTDGRILECALAGRRRRAWEERRRPSLAVRALPERLRRAEQFRRSCSE
jgi:hypothetical protein